MAYTRTTWQQRLAQYQNRFSVTNNPDGTLSLTPFEGSVTQAGTAITPDRLNNVERGIELSHLFGTTTNTGNAYVLSTGKNVTLAELTGLSLRVQINAASTGAATLNVDGQGAKNVLKASGEAAELLQNAIYTLVYNGTSFILQGEGGLSNYFGDGSDGSFNPATILAAATAPNGGTVANLWDMNTGTTFVASAGAGDAVLLSIDFGTPQSVYSYFFSAVLSTGSRNLKWQFSVDNLTWTDYTSIAVSTSSGDKGGSTGTQPGAYRYWRALLAAGTACTFTCQGLALNHNFITLTDTQTTKVWNIVYPSALNGPAVVKQFSSLTLPAGYSMTVEKPCQGLIIYCQGNAVINGTIDMSKKAGLAPNGNIIPMPITKKAKKTAKTSSLLHFNGNVTDDSGRTWTNNGGATFDTTNKKFGTSAISFNGSSQWLSTPASDDLYFAHDDFTIDCWVRPTALSRVNLIFADYPSAGTPYVNCYIDNVQNQIRLDYQSSSGLVRLSRTTAVVANTWYHVEVTRQNGFLRLFVDGVLASEAYIPFIEKSGATTFCVGGSSSLGSYFQGQIDEFRIIKGKAVWTANFTPPTAEYTYTATYTDEPKTLEKYLQLTSVLQALRGGYGGNGGYGGGNRSGSGRVSGGIGGSGRINQGGFGAGGGAGQQSGYAGMGGTIQFAELGGGFVDISSAAVSFLAINGRDGGGGTNGMRSSGRCYGGGGGGVGSITTTTGGTAPTSGEYAGGFICLIVSGTVSGNGAITANGGNGGNGGNSSTSDDMAGGGGGGGSGGGVIMELYAGQNTFSGTRSVNGGTGGTGGTATGSVGYKGENGGAGSSGGIGTIHLQQVA